MQIDRRMIAHFDWLLFFLTLALVGIGITTIYSANFNMAEGHAGVLPMRQATWLGLGLIAMFTAWSFDYHYIDRLVYPFYGAMLMKTTPRIIAVPRSGWIRVKKISGPTKAKGTQRSRR